MKIKSLASWVCIVLVVSLSGCASTHKIQGTVGGKPGSHKVTEVIYVASREEILKFVSEQLDSAGVDLKSIENGDVVIGRIYCCGGTGTVETENNVFVYVPHDLQVKYADILEFVEGQGATGKGLLQLNVAVRVRHESGIGSNSCKWLPEKPNLWFRVLYCPWMENEGWVEGSGLSPEWYKIPER